MWIELVFLLQTAMTWRTPPANDLYQGDQVTYTATYVESLSLSISPGAAENSAKRN